MPSFKSRLLYYYPLLAPLFPEATRAMGEISAFITAHLHQNLPDK